MKKLSIVTPSYLRYELTVKSFEKVLHREEVDEVVIVDDASHDDSFQKLYDHFKGNLKVVVVENGFNLDCFHNKKRAIELSSNPFCILLDSDNEIDETYLDKILSLEWDERTIYTPDWASPHFDFRAYSGLEITKENVAQYIDLPMFETMLNAANYFVNKDQYLEVWDSSIDPVTSDSIWVCYKWLEAGNKIKVVEGLQYFHRVWEGSHYRQNNSRTPVGLHENILNKLRQLK